MLTWFNFTTFPVPSSETLETKLQNYVSTRNNLWEGFSFLLFYVQICLSIETTQNIELFYITGHQIKNPEMLNVLLTGFTLAVAILGFSIHS